MIRIRRGSIQVPRKTFTNGKRTIILYGVSHVAEASFWANANHDLNELQNDGYEVHFESVVNDMDPEPKLHINYEHIAGILRLQAQKDGLRYGADWKRTDITTSQLFAESCMEDVNRRGDQIKEAFEDQADAMANISPAFLRWVVKLTLLASQVFPTPSLMGIPRAIILDQRNSVALNAALRARRNIVAVWGAEHLKGISAGLIAHGFKHVSTEWTTAIAGKPA